MAKQQFALVTGASSGIGKAFAKDLAKRGYNLIIVARRAELLQALADEMKQTFGVEVLTLTLDLSLPTAAQSVLDFVVAQKVEVEVLVNNAGIGMHGKMLQQDLDKITQMLQLNITTLTQLTFLFGRQMAQKNKGYILQVSSVGAFQPSPNYAAYAATKAYVMLLGEALDEELRNTDVHVTTLYPGATVSEFFDVANQQLNPFLKRRLIAAETVAAKGLDGMFAGKRSVLYGIVNNIMVACVKFMPRKLATRIAGWVMK
jgi:short-subunit dehydrogenase